MRRPTRWGFRGKADTAGVNERSSTPSRCAGVVATACTQGKRTQHGKPQGVVREDQPDAREGQIGRLGVAERFAVPLKPGNSGGGRGPQFKTDATSGEGFGDWATYQLRKLFRNCRSRCTRKRRQNPAIASTRFTTRSSGLDVAEEGFDLTSHRFGLPRQFAGRRENLVCGGAGIAGGLLDTGDVG